MMPLEKQRILRPLLALILLINLGCRDSTAPEVFDPVGTLSFAYQGTASGSFNATGPLDIGPDMLPQPVTGATAFDEQGVLSLIASRERADSRLDLFWIMLGDVKGPGVLPLDPLQCSEESIAACRVGFFVPDVDPAELLQAPDVDRLLEAAYVMVMGQVNITSLTPLRVRGTFTGNAARLVDESLQGLVLITGGTFDLPRRPQ